MAGEQIPSKDALPNWKRFIRRPETGVALGALGIAVTILLTWWLYPSVDPTYRAFPADTVARKESPRLTVAWDGVPIENLCVSRIALWNAGSQPITQDKLPTSDPLRIVPTQTVRILAVELANSSRPTLTLDTKIVKSNEADHVQLSIHGGDAMEKGEGVAVRLLFTGDCKSDFEVAGRVIGSNGFRRIRPQLVFVFIFYPVFLIMFGVGFAWLSTILFDSQFFDRPFPKRIRLRGMIILSLLAVMLVSGLFVFLVVQPWAEHGPTLSWLPQ